MATRPTTEDLMRDKDNPVPDRDVAKGDRDNLKTDTEQEQTDAEVEAHLSGALGTKQRDGLPQNP